MKTCIEWNNAVIYPEMFFGIQFSVGDFDINVNVEE